MLKPHSIISHTLSSLNRSPPGPDSIPSMSFSIRKRTISSAAESLASNRQCVIAADNDCIASESLGESGLMRLYEKNFVMATRAREVMGAEVAEACMTCRNGCNKEGVSNLCISCRKSVICNNQGQRVSHTFASRQFMSQSSKPRH
jgi:hypothetical protein